MTEFQTELLQKIDTIAGEFTELLKEQNRLKQDQNDLLNELLAAVIAGASS